MKMLTKAYVYAHKNEILDEMRAGKIFVYPTDTIYGLGCNALDSEAVKKIREIKKRIDEPFSVIVPSKEWISINCSISFSAKEWITKIPGAYTLILPLKGKVVPDEVNCGKETLGIRIPNHWFYEFIIAAGIPFVTTSANLSGKNHMTSYYDLDDNLKQSVDYVVYDGAIRGNPSTIVDLTEEKAKVVTR